MRVNEEFLLQESVNQSIAQPKPKSQPQVKPRGLTMAGMILVNNQGDIDKAIWPLHETDWNGISTADMVFPSFLFIIGMAIQLALKLEMKNDPKTWKKIFKRIILLFLIGLLLNLQDCNFNIYHVRIMGVLQRISLCYLIVVLIHLLISDENIQMMVISLILALYLALMYGIYVPCCGKGILTEECNIGTYIDLKIFGQQHIYDTYDPEGLISTFNSIMNVYCGKVFMKIFQQCKDDQSKLIKKWFILSTYLIALSLILVIWIPYNKKLWTTSFAFITCGISGFALLICYIFFDIFKNRVSEFLKWPFIWLGMNPLFIYIAMMFYEALFTSNIQFEYDGEKTSLWSWINDILLNSWIKNEEFSSLIFSLINLILWTFLAKIMYEKQIFIKL